MLTRSVELAQIVRDKSDKGALRSVRELAFMETQGRPAKVISTLEALERCGMMRPGVDITWCGVERGSTTFVLFFEGSADEAVAKVAALPLPKKGKTAESVLIKMAVARIVKVQKSIKKHNDWIHQYQQTSPNSRAQLVDPLTRERLTPSAMDGKKMGFTFGDRDVTDLHRFLRRPDVTQEILDQAWSVYGVYRTHEE